MVKVQRSSGHKMLCLRVRRHKMLRLNGWLVVPVLVPAR
jgi:hypothetical protein